MKKIVVPVDFSGDSINALEHAIVYANHLEAEIFMVHVKKKKAYYTNKLGIDSINTGDDTQVIAYFDQIIGKVKDQVKFNIGYELRKGKIFQEIINYSKYNDADMIIMGTHGISGFEERWIGSNAYRVVSNAHCPVITIRMDYMIKEINRIILPIDTTDETLQKVPFIAELASLFNASVVILSIRETKKPAEPEKLEKHLRQAESFLERSEVSFQTEEIQGSNLAELAMEYALEYGGNLIATMREQSESNVSIWLGPSAQQLVNHSPVPVISFPNF